MPSQTSCLSFLSKDGIHGINHLKQHQLPGTALLMAKKKGSTKAKGFGKQKVETTSSPPADDVPPAATTTTKIETPTISAGEQALSRLRRQKAEEKDEELRAIRELKSVDKYVASEPDAAVIPEKVAQRMGQRMLPFVGIPLFGVMGTFVLFWYLATYRNLEFQPSLVAFSTIGVLGISLLGITYSVMSASWDPDKEGSLIGAEEFKTNFGNIQDGLKRTRENAILREKMIGLPEAEVERAINDLNKRDQREAEKKMTMGQKLDKELE